MADVMAFRVVTVSPDDPVQVAITRMLEETVGSVGVCEGERAGRDLHRARRPAARRRGANFAEVKVGDVMTRQLVTLAPDDDILDAARLMGERKIRHLPVLEGENLLGMVGIREVIRALVERLWRTHDPEARDRARELLDRESGEMKSGSLREP